MKEIKHTRMVEEIIGYQAEDGKNFRSKEECETYEETAKAVIFNEFKQLMINGEPFSENNIWENFGYGNEDFALAVIEIKDEHDLHIANMYSEAYKYGYTFPKEMIGKRVLVSLGYFGAYGDCAFFPRTEEELIESFSKTIEKVFHTDDELKAKEEK